MAVIPLVGPNGEASLFYAEKHEEEWKILVAQCEDHTNLDQRNLREDCIKSHKEKSGHRPQYISSTDFKASLKLVMLKLPIENINSLLKDHIEIYNAYSNGLSDDVVKLFERRSELKSTIKVIEGFYNREDRNLEQLSTFKAELSSVEEELGDHLRFNEMVEVIDRYITDVMEDIFDSDVRNYYRYSLVTTAPSFYTRVFGFNILKSYLKFSPLRPSFQRIEAGEFQMGSPSNERNRNNNENGNHGRQVKIKISKPFKIMTTEMTQWHWFLETGENPSFFKKPTHCDNHIVIDEVEMCPTHPVENLSREEVLEFIAKKNENLGPSGGHGTPQDPTGRLRLATEAEWEFAARAGTTTAYFFGDNPGLLGNYACYYVYSNPYPHTCRVGQFIANAYGLYDMYGNVSEMVQDNYRDTLFRWPNRTDPLYQNPESLLYVERGGSFIDSSSSLRSAFRHKPTSRPNQWRFMGLRLVETL